MKIKQLYNKPDKWIQGENCLDKNGNPTRLADRKSHCFCLVGAVEKCYGGSVKWEATLSKISLALNLKYKHNDKKSVVYLPEMSCLLSIIDWNDNKTRTFEEVKLLVNELDL